MSTTTEASVPAHAPGEPDIPFDFLTWFELNRLRIALGLAVVVVGVVGFLFIRWQKDQTELAADSALMALIGSETAASPVSSKALLAVAESHSGTRAAERAQLLAAGRVFSEGKYSEAQSMFEKFNVDFPESTMAATAFLGIATALDAQNKTNDSISAYQRLISGFATDPLALRARVNKAHLHEGLNQATTALSLYEEVARSASTDPIGQEAAIARARLIAAHPELAPSNSVTNSVRANPPAARP